MKYSLFVLFLFLISSNVYCQSEALHGDAFWDNLETYRSDLVKGREGDFERIDSLYWIMASRFKSYTKASHLTSRVIIAGVINEMSYQEYVASILVKDKNDNIESNLLSEEYNFIVKHHELIDFKRSILIKFRPPFLVDTSKIQQELEFYKFERNDVCADIGTSTGSFGFLMAALDLDLEIYVTDVSRLEYLKRNLDKWNDLDYLEEINFREGSEDKLNLPVTCDKNIYEKHLTSYQTV